ncbi:MAG: alpha/beta hydrolase family esterase [Acidimicrobiales bacterium]
MQLGCLLGGRRVLVGAALVALVQAGAACGGSSPASSTSSTSATSAQAAESGCGRTAQPGSVTLTLPSGGHQRVVIVHVPTGYTGKTEVALVINLHGSESTAHDQELFSGMDTTSDRHGFVVAYPQGLIASGAGFDWNIPGVPLVGGANPPAGAANDVSFLTGLVAQLAARYCVNSSRVYVTGMSGGGRMASQLACDESATFAAAAPIAGLRMPTPCPSDRPVAIIAFHGTADPIDPYGGNGQAYWTYSVPVAAQRWGAFDQCQTIPQTASGSGYTLTRYVGCTGGTSVELYALAGEGHEWPGGPHMPRAITSALGPQTQAVDANALMWAFFEAHPRP